VKSERMRLLSGGLRRNEAGTSKLMGETCQRPPIRAVPRVMTTA
jgi:hypothetical protein